MKVEAKWTGKYPNLCSGWWILKVNNKDVSYLIPKDLRTSPMNTYGEHKSFHFNKWEEIWNSYEDGLDCEDWIEENQNWLNKITTDHSVQVDIYYAINSQDWRYGECGGCI